MAEKYYLDASIYIDYYENRADKRKVPLGDALHAVIARDNKAILVTRDHHFEELADITKPMKPEDLI